MNKSMVTGIVVGAAIITAGGAVAGYQFYSEPRFAEVLAVEPIIETVRTPREECEDVSVTHTKQAKDQHKVTGTVVGAVVGGMGNRLMGKKIVGNARQAFGKPPARWPSTLHVLPAANSE